MYRDCQNPKPRQKGKPPKAARGKRRLAATLKGLRLSRPSWRVALRKVAILYIILQFLPVFKPVFLLSRVWQQNGLNAAAGLCLPPANLRRQLHIGNGMGLGTEAESPNVRWGSGGKDGSLR